MFKFLKNKIKDAVKKFSSNAAVEETESEVTKEVPIEETTQEELLKEPKDISLEESATEFDDESQEDAQNAVVEGSLEDSTDNENIERVPEELVDSEDSEEPEQVIDDADTRGVEEETTPKIEEPVQESIEEVVEEEIDLVEPQSAQEEIPSIPDIELPQEVADLVESQSTQETELDKETSDLFIDESVLPKKESVEEDVIKETGEYVQDSQDDERVETIEELTSESEEDGLKEVQEDSQDEVEENILDVEEPKDSQDEVEDSQEEIPSEEDQLPLPISENESGDEEESAELIPELPEEEPQKKKGFFKRLFGKKEEELPSIDDPLVEEISAEDDFEDGIIAGELLEDEQEAENIEEELSDSTFDAQDTPTPQEVSSKEDGKEDIVQTLAEEVVEDIPVSKVEKESVEQPKEKQSPTELLDEVKEDATKKKKGFFAKIKEKITKFQLTEEVFEDVFWDFELALLENNVALEVIEKVKADMHEQLTKENVTRKSVDEVILDTLKKSLDEVLTVETFDLFEKISTKKPYVITMIGVNGSGKTTTLAKIVHLLQKKGLSVVVAASDTFRAAAIQQLEEHTTKLGVKLIKHDYNADPSAVAFDAISHAKAKDIDVVLIDTAGRLQSNSNLMDELKKLIRVNTPDLNIFIGESVTGNDCVEQAMAFNDAVGIDGIVLSKADIDEKGGAAISVSYVTKKPILFIGTGQTYDDLKPFSKFEVLENLGL